MVKLDVKARITNAAVKLFAQKGYEKTTTRDICRAAGISHGMLHYYFDGKDSVLFTIMEGILSDALQRIEKIFRSEQSLISKLEDMVSIHTRYQVAETDKMKIYLLEQRSLKKSHKKHLVKKEREFLRIFTELLNGIQEQGEMLNLDTTVCAFAFFGMVHMTYSWYDPKGKIRPNELAQIFNRIFTGGVLIQPLKRGESNDTKFKGVL